MALWTALTFGLLGSWHCVGMCGPIALALPYQGMSLMATIRSVLLYNFGRIGSYGIIGILPGLIGTGLSFAGQQKTLSIVLGSFFIISALFSLNLERKFWAIPFVSKQGQHLQKRMGDLLKTGHIQAFLGIGFLNGFLPCGLVYLALAGAMLQGTVINGMLYMMFFGLGTLPLMLMVSLMGQLISTKLRNQIKKIIPLFMVLLGILLILRGTQINLPYNLQLWLEYGVAPICH